MVSKERIEYMLLAGQIRHAERALAEQGAADPGSQAVPACQDLLSRLHDERRVLLEGMMQLPFASAEHDAR